MLIFKQGYPEKSDLVICTVSKIQFNSIFVTLDEYQRKQGIIHISEISPGRIRNIRDYVKEGKVIVCVVLRVNTERDLIELSLRRVQEGQRRKKINGMKQEQKAEKLIENVAKIHKLDAKELTLTIINKIQEEYSTVHPYFEDIVMGNAKIDLLDLSNDISKTLDETIRQRIKPPEVSIKGRFFVTTYDPNGVGIIKVVMDQAKKAGGDSITLSYLGAGKYDINVISEDYKSAEKILDKVQTVVQDEMKKHQGECRFNRTDK